jgi:hypothetical protein
MAESKYGHLICTEITKNIPLPPWEQGMVGEGLINGYRRASEHVAWIDASVIPGSFYSEVIWVWNPSMPNQRPSPDLTQAQMEKMIKGLFPHSHPFPELLAYFGLNMDHPEELGGEIEFCIGDEKYILNKSFIVYIPSNVPHGPIKRKYLKDNSFFHYTIGPGSEYEKTLKNEILISQSEQKYARCFVSGDNKSLTSPFYRHLTDPEHTRRLACIDQDTVPGAEFGVENMWLLPGGPEQKIMYPNKVKHDRLFGFYSYNYDNIRNLCAEVELYIGGERHTVNKSFAVFIPANLEVGLITIRNISKPVFFMVAAQCGKKYEDINCHS